jgi:hypothetical protein
MARSTPKLGARGQGSAWRDRPHVLTNEACKHLAKFIGLTPGNDPQALDGVLAEVSRLLGLYLPAVQALDNAPRASEYVQSFGRLATQACDLRRGLDVLSPHVREQLDAYLIARSTGSLESAEKAIRDLVTSLEEGQRSWRKTGVKSSGRPKQVALRMVVGDLRAVFRRYYRGPLDANGKRGKFIRRREMEKRERDFITAALSDAHIEARDLDKLLLSLSKTEPRLDAKDRELVAQIIRAAKITRRSR